MKKTINVMKFVGLILLTLSLVGFIFQADTTAVVPSVPEGFISILGWVLFALSEIFAFIPGLKSNAVIQLVYAVLTSVYKKFKP
jgi:ABC-type uncharacterized transport system permease subunit